jgi:hypothetical protein
MNVPVGNMLFTSTVAVNTTSWPAYDGLGDEVTDTLTGPPLACIAAGARVNSSSTIIITGVNLRIRDSLFIFSLHDQCNRGPIFTASFITVARDNINIIILIR